MTFKNNDVALLEYKSFMDVLTETRDFLVLDLGRMNLRIGERYKACIRPLPEAVYITGRLDPILVFGEGRAYYTLPQYQKRGAPDIVSFDTFIAAKSRIVDASGKMLLSFPPSLKPQLFQKTCSYDYTAIHNAVIVIWGLLNRLHAMTVPTTSVRSAQLDLESYIQEQHLGVQNTEGVTEYNEEDQPGVFEVMDKVQEFIGRDHHALYHLSLKNTELRINKGLDYRVVEYYRMLFDYVETQEETMNGILKIYED